MKTANVALTRDECQLVTRALEILSRTFPDLAFQASVTALKMCAGARAAGNPVAGPAGLDDDREPTIVKDDRRGGDISDRDDDNREPNIV